MRDFSGKVALIPGGASGVGRFLAFALGQRGARADMILNRDTPVPAMVG
jgi:NAD(P)-dependent dehydrogenase (short-subunit alcohol dehydrogenase family)